MRYHLNTFIIGFSIILSLFFLFGCEGPAGPQGPQGDTGKDGLSILSASNLEGFKEGIKCATCHDPDTDTTYRVITKEVQYDMSGHRELGNYDRNTTTCAGCHTNEGFYERYNRGFANETFSLTSPSGPIVYQNYYNSSPVGCFTCHLPHRRGNFTLRDTGAVNIFTLVAGQNTIQWNSTPSSNLCVKCHQPRMTSTPLMGNTPSWRPDPTKTASTDTAKIYTTRYNNHVSGENVQNLLGFGGVEFSGYTYTNYANSYGHTNLVKTGVLGCEDCHMATPIGNKGGGHTFKIGYIPEGSTTESFNFAGCNTTSCHAGAVKTTDSHWTKRNEIRIKLNQLGKLMMDTTITKKWSPSFKSKYTGIAFPWTKMTVDGADTSWALSDSVTSPSVKGLFVIPAFKAGAIWNFEQVVYDPSLGIHNYRYVKELLESSIAELNK
jgi:hypothetical protein